MDLNKIYRDIYIKQWKEKGKTLLEFEKQYGVNKSTLGSWIRGDTKNSPTSIQGIKKFMEKENITIKDFEEKQNEKETLEENPNIFQSFKNYFYPQELPIIGKKGTLKYTLEKKGKKEIEDFEVTPVVKEFPLRKGVTDLAPQVWKYRNDQDVYRFKNELETKLPEVDHCIEIQLLNDAFINCKPNGRPLIYSLVKDKVNGIENLNVTTHEVNQAKKGPITSFISRLKSKYFILRLTIFYSKE